MDNTQTSPDDMLNEQALCDWLGFTLAWARSCRLRGTGPKFIRIGTRVRYRRGDVQAWLDSQTYISTTRKAEPVAA